MQANHQLNAWQKRILKECRSKNDRDELQKAFGNPATLLNKYLRYAYKPDYRIV
jgi:hypothetical protein